MKTYKLTAKIFSGYKKLSLSCILKLFLNFSKFERQYCYELYSCEKSAYKVDAIILLKRTLCISPRNNMFIFNFSSLIIRLYENVNKSFPLEARDKLIVL